MKKTSIAIAAVGVAVVMGSCTERRRATAPTPDGDTIEVVIRDPAPLHEAAPAQMAPELAADTAAGDSIQPLQ